MGLRFGTSAREVPEKLAVVRSVRWPANGFELVCREARARGMDPTAYVREAALARASQDYRARTMRASSTGGGGNSSGGSTQGSPVIRR